jgi:hypothetical protein
MIDADPDYAVDSGSRTRIGRFRLARKAIEMSEPKKRIRSDTVMHPFMEERLQEKDNKRDSRAGPDLPLKNDSGQMELGSARIWEEHVRNLLESHPEHYQALRALIEGRGEAVSEQHLRDLRKWHYLDRDRTPLPHIHAIMKAAARDTPDGPCLVDPFDLRTPESAETIQSLTGEHRRRGLDRLLRKLGATGGDKSR